MPRTRTSSIELLVRLERDHPAPLHHQLEQQLRAGIRSGRLRAGATLPSSRALADQLELSRGVVVEAYEQLVAEGYLTSQPGGATRVCAKVVEATAPASTAPRSPHQIDFAYGRPDVVSFPRQDWLRSIRRVLDEAPSDRLTYGDGRGVPELRDALAMYLNRVRGTAAHADRIVVCNGFTQGFALFTDLVRATGGRRIALEDPGYHDAVLIAQRSGLKVVRIPVDDGGMMVDALERSRVDAAVVTPAHQYPTGGVLSPERRAALIAWASRRDRLVLEDDYDAEFRYDREPIGALHGLAPELVVYSGTASKTLAPGLRLGWLIVPAAHIGAVAASKTLSDGGSAALEQLAFADFLSRGEFDHHLRRMRPVYRARRDALLDALRRYAPDLRPVGASAGLHVLAWLPPELDERAISARAAELGVGIAGLAKFGSTRTDLPGALLFGYGTTGERRITEGVRLIGQAIDELRSGSRESGTPAGG